MEDKELYTYFKDRKDAFNEAPNDALWAKIDAGLSNTMPTTPKSGSIIAGKGLLIAATVVSIVVTLLVVLIPKKEVKQSTLPQQKTIITEQEHIETTTEIDTVKPKKVADAVVTASHNAVIKPQVKPVNATSKTITNQVIAFKPFQDTLIPNTVKLNQNKIRVMIMVSPVSNRLKRVHVRVDQQVTQHQYDSLVTTIVNDNNLAIGTLLTIKVKGHSTYKKVIDGTKLPVPDDTFTPEVIKFRSEADTLITVSGKTTYHANATGFEKIIEPVLQSYYVNADNNVESKKEKLEEKVTIITTASTITSSTLPYLDPYVNWEPIYLNNCTGMINEQHDVVVEPVYDVIEHFNEVRYNRAMVERDGLFGLIDETGKEIVAPHYEIIFMDDKKGSEPLMVYNNEPFGFGFIDVNGNVLVKPVYKSGNEAAKQLKTIIK